MRHDSNRGSMFERVFERACSNRRSIERVFEGTGLVQDLVQSRPTHLPREGSGRAGPGRGPRETTDQPDHRPSSDATGTTPRTLPEAWAEAYRKGPRTREL